MHPSLSAPYKCPLHFRALFLNRDSFIHEFYNLPLDITPRSLLKAILDIACPCVISTVNSSNATGAIAVLFHACKRTAACKSDKNFNSFGPIFMSLLFAQVTPEYCPHGTNMFSSQKVDKLTFPVSWLCCFPHRLQGSPHNAKSRH